MCLCLWLNAPPKSDVPTIELNMFNGANGLIFGFPMRFRMMAAHLLDSSTAPVEALMDQGLMLVMEQDRFLRLNCCKHSTRGIFLPPSPRSSRMLHKAYNSLVIDEVENEDFVFTLETVMAKFGEEMAPYWWTKL
ncbi:hypothetical protein Ahy_A05g024746 isoform B [Arachis hypogaea]|uniref:Uncharacterized protein n=1 Tax=Arachis hypogaea TaxID=3818 RepID=A0A445D6Y8_ARAHY|nr:hypothetical protein Ahy_A05g024746 isoform B [Arachis hypogaea]